MTPAASPQDIQERVQAIQQSLPSGVTLIAVTKFFPAEWVRRAYAVGIRNFGESRVQEALQKQADLKNLQDTNSGRETFVRQDLQDITWHLIGHLQSNKIRKAVEHFQWIHSIDSLKVAQKIDQAAAELGVQPQGCLQVKMVPDPAKYGFNVPELNQVLPALDQLVYLKIRGIMTIPPLHTPEPEVREIFARTAALAKDINQRRYDRISIDQLSMGMSGDYRAAIAAGSTMIRLGTVLFGPRPKTE